MDFVKEQVKAGIAKGKEEVEKKVKEEIGKDNGTRALDVGSRAISALDDALTGKTRAAMERANKEIEKQTKMNVEQSAAAQARTKEEVGKRAAAQSRATEAFLNKSDLYAKYGWDNTNPAEYRAKQIQFQDVKKDLVDKLVATGLYERDALMRKDYPEVAELAQKVLKKLSPKKSGKKQTKK